MEETLFEKLIHAMVFLALCGAIVGIGWREPLRYRFMSAEQIAEEIDALQPPPPTPAPSPTPRPVVDRFNGGRLNDMSRPVDLLDQPPTRANSRSAHHH